jgi:hypothetical protein
MRNYELILLRVSRNYDVETITASLSTYFLLFAFCFQKLIKFIIFLRSVAELHYFYAAPALGKNFDAAPTPAAPAPTVL